MPRRHGHGRGRCPRRARSSPSGRLRRASCTASPTATSRRSSASSSTGRGRVASRSSAPARGRSTFPSYHAVTPEHVWDHYGLTAEQVVRGRLQRAHVHVLPRRDEVGDRDGGRLQRDGLEPQDRRASRSRPAAPLTSPRVCVPVDAGGALSRGGTVEVVSSLERDGTPVADDLRWGVFVTFDPGSESASRRLADYGVAHRPVRPLRLPSTARTT